MACTPLLPKLAHVHPLCDASTLSPAFDSVRACCARNRPAHPTPCWDTRPASAFSESDVGPLRPQSPPSPPTRVPRATLTRRAQARAQARQRARAYPCKALERTRTRVHHARTHTRKRTLTGTQKNEKHKRVELITASTKANASSASSASSAQAHKHDHHVDVVSSSGSTGMTNEAQGESRRPRFRPKIAKKDFFQ